MPDTLFAQPTAQPPVAPAGNMPCAIRSKIWSAADNIVSGDYNVEVAFGLLWEVLEDVSGLAVRDEQEGRGKSLLTQSDRLYFICNKLHDLTRAARKHADAIIEATRDMPREVPDSDNAIALRWGELLIAEQALNAQAEERGDPTDEIADAYHAAQERFVAEPATTAAGVLLKLERAFEVDSVEKELADNPSLVGARLLRGAIHDLRAMLAQPAQVS